MAWADSVTVRRTMRAGTLTESFAPADTAVVLNRMRAPVSDSFAPTDAVSGLFRYKAEEPQENYSPTDTVTARFVFRGAFSDSATWDDIVNANKVNVGGAFPLSYSDLTEDFGSMLSDALSGLERLLGSASESNQLSDAATVIEVMIGSASDSWQMSDSASAVTRLMADVSDTWSIDDDTSALFRYRASATELFFPVDSVTKSDGTAPASSFIPIIHPLRTMKPLSMGR